MNKKLSSWIKAFRLRTLPLAIASVGMGGVIAFEHNGFNITIFLLILVTALSLQILSNLANDYGDAKSGLDFHNRTGPERSVQSGRIALADMKNAVIIAAVISLISGIFLLITALYNKPETFGFFLVVGLVSIVAAIAYTNGSIPYGYVGLGDIAVFFFFGLVGVGGTFYLLTSKLELTAVLPAISIGLLSTGVLNINNIRDMKSDKESGKYSIPVRLGVKGAVIYHWTLLFGAMISLAIFKYMNTQSMTEWLFILIYPLIILNGVKIHQIKSTQALDPYLRQLSISTLLMIILYWTGLFF